MTPEEIKARREELDIEREEMKTRHNIESTELGFEYQKIQLRCKHPDAYEYSIMGRDTGWRCPDCGSNK